MIGCGRTASLFEEDPLRRKPASHMGHYRKSRRIRVVAGADIDCERREFFKHRWRVKHVYRDYREMLAAERPDIVSLTAYAPERHIMFKHCAEAGVKAIWIEKGRIVMEDQALAVVKAYEEFTQRLQYEARKRQDEAKKQQQKVTISGNGATSSPLESRWLREKLLEQVLGATKDSVENGMNVAVSPGNISRWASEGGLRIERIRLLDDRGEELRVVHTGSPLDIEIEFTAEKRDDYTCFYVILLFTEDGRWLSRHCSESDRFNMACGERRKVRLKYPKILLGNGRYFFSAALYRELDLQRVNSARCYDLLSRSFEFTVKDHYPDDQTLFHHPASWVSVE